MKIISAIFGVLAILAGFGTLVSAIQTPQQYVHTDNAVINTAIYSEATFKAVVAVALFVFAGVCVMSWQAPPQERPPLPGPRPGDGYTYKPQVSIPLASDDPYKAQFEEIRALVNAKKYMQAREYLNTLKSPKATEWHKYLDDIGQ